MHTLLHIILVHIHVFISRTINYTQHKQHAHMHALDHSVFIFVHGVTIKGKVIVLIYLACQVF